MSKFQIIIFTIFILLGAIGVLVFATFRSSSNLRDVELTIWGEEDAAQFRRFVAEFRKNTPEKFKIEYQQIESSDFVNTVNSALASDTGPDIVVLSSEDVLRFEDKIFPIPYEVVSERNFRDTFIEGSEIFLTSAGVLGLPFSVDPLVTYWNRDILQSNIISNPPKFWSEFFPFAERITDKDEALNIRRSAAALGGYNNINNAKEIILAMLFQNDNKVISRDTLGRPEVIIAENSGRSVAPAESVVRFYTEFSNPAKTSYSWNNSLPLSMEVFSAGDLALYFGFASELSVIRDKNPNLNFDVSLFPQPTDDINKKTFGRIKSFAVMKRSANVNTAMSLVSALIREDNIKSYSDLTRLPPVRRSLLADKPGLAFEDLFYESALVAHAFLDPNPEESGKVFEDLVERVVSGRERITTAVSRADSELTDIVVEN
jgi:ABC-type glycerol-3-phosphate transport system substrate-binding protein